MDGLIDGWILLCLHLRILKREERGSRYYARLLNEENEWDKGSFSYGNPTEEPINLA